MAVKNFGGNKGSSKNYGIRKLENGSRVFVTECEATDPSAIKFIRQKDGNNFKAGDVFYAAGGNAISGVLAGAWVRDGYNTTVGKELNLGFKSADESGNIVTEFVKLSLVNDKGRIDNATARLLTALNKADLGEELTLAIHTFKHKAGDVMNEQTGAKWEKDGDNVILSAYQEHLVTNENKHGIIKVEKGEHYTQPTFFVKGKDVVQITPETKVPEGAVVQYDTEDAAAFYTGLVTAINSKVGNAAKDAPAESVGNTVGDDDMKFGGDDEASRSRMGNRPS